MLMPTAASLTTQVPTRVLIFFKGLRTDYKYLTYPPLRYLDS